MAGHFKLLPILLLALFTLTVTSQQLIGSINCGGVDLWQWSSDFTFIPWGSDDNLVSNGEARVVPSSNSLFVQVMNTLRVFTSQKKNCYPKEVTLGQKVLVRASFYYGNYDGLSKPPTFDLHFDGNFWTTVETSSTELTVHEITYVTKGNAVSVCVAQTKHDQFPFMSALEIRSVASGVYDEDEVDNNRALFLINRFAYAPSDPPPSISRNALTSTTDSLVVTTLSPSNGPYYIITYYSEVNSSSKRSFELYETSTSGSNSLWSRPLSPSYGSVDQRYIYNYTVDSITTISLNATVDSDLPPLINAIEVFRVGDVLTSGTDSNDVEAPGSTIVAGKKKSKLPVILGTTIPSFLLIWIAAGIITIVRRKMKPANANGSATG
ncbi:malectin-like carbohydrate-binding domain-containing protein [Artemisia annua]|uniref:Malectin-like carbohydrate-binding domain-containing protein n=1 Tax=Artemisia annua TaxID=35608 RepID=A0A2U1KUS9_ARTAN|nr:malectin-like carbohydrate-binding domain-containing protein [Artemisia annua]